MAKKTLIFVVMVAVSIVVILSFVGWSQTNRKREPEKKKVRTVISQKLQEIKIVAVEEKILPPTRKAKKRNKKRLKKKQVEVAKIKKPVKRLAAKEKAGAERGTGLKLRVSILRKKRDLRDIHK